MPRWKCCISCVSGRTENLPKVSSLLNFRVSISVLVFSAYLQVYLSLFSILWRLFLLYLFSQLILQIYGSSICPSKLLLCLFSILYSSSLTLFFWLFWLTSASEDLLLRSLIPSSSRLPFPMAPTCIYCEANIPISGLLATQDWT